MRNDVALCADYDPKKCMANCYRGYKTKEQLEVGCGICAVWAHFKYTNECPLTGAKMDLEEEK